MSAEGEDELGKARVRDLHLQQTKIVENLSRELERVKRIHQAAKTAAMALEMLDDPRDQQAAMALLEPYSRGFLSSASSSSAVRGPTKSPARSGDAELPERTTPGSAVRAEREAGSSG